MTKRALIGLLIAAVFFTAVYGAFRFYFPGIDAWIAAVVAGVSGIFGFFNTVLDFIKKPLEVNKLWLENQKLRREAERGRKAEEAGKRLVQTATPDEVKEYGKSYMERQLHVHYRKESGEFLSARGFVEHEEEERDGP